MMIADSSIQTFLGQLAVLDWGNYVMATLFITILIAFVLVSETLCTANISNNDQEPHDSHQPPLNGIRFLLLG